MEKVRLLELQIKESLSTVDESEFETYKDFVEYIIEELIMYSNGLEEKGDISL